MKTAALPATSHRSIPCRNLNINLDIRSGHKCPDLPGTLNDRETGVSNQVKVQIRADKSSQHPQPWTTAATERVKQSNLNSAWIIWIRSLHDKKITGNDLGVWEIKLKMQQEKPPASTGSQLLRVRTPQQFLVFGDSPALDCVIIIACPKCLEVQRTKTKLKKIKCLGTASFTGSRVKSQACLETLHTLERSLQKGFHKERIKYGRCITQCFFFSRIIG